MRTVVLFFLLFEYVICDPPLYDKGDQNNGSASEVIAAAENLLNSSQPTSNTDHSKENTVDTVLKILNSTYHHGITNTTFSFNETVEYEENAGEANGRTNNKNNVDLLEDEDQYSDKQNSSHERRNFISIVENVTSVLKTSPKLEASETNLTKSAVEYNTMKNKSLLEDYPHSDIKLQQNNSTNVQDDNFSADNSPDPVHSKIYTRSTYFNDTDDTVRSDNETNEYKDQIFKVTDNNTTTTNVTINQNDTDFVLNYGKTINISTVQKDDLSIDAIQNLTSVGSILEKPEVAPSRLIADYIDLRSNKVIPPKRPTINNLAVHSFVQKSIPTIWDNYLNNKTSFTITKKTQTNLKETNIMSEPIISENSHSVGEDLLQSIIQEVVDNENTTNLNKPTDKDGVLVLPKNYINKQPVVIDVGKDDFKVVSVFVGNQERKFIVLSDKEDPTTTNELHKIYDYNSKTEYHISPHQTTNLNRDHSLNYQEKENNDEKDLLSSDYTEPTVKTNLKQKELKTGKIIQTSTTISEKKTMYDNAQIGVDNVPDKYQNLPDNFGDLQNYEQSDVMPLKYENKNTQNEPQTMTLQELENVIANILKSQDTISSHLTDAEILVKIASAIPVILKQIKSHTPHITDDHVVKLKALVISPDITVKSSKKTLIGSSSDIPTKLNENLDNQDHYINNNDDDDVTDPSPKKENYDSENADEMYTIILQAFETYVDDSLPQQTSPISQEHKNQIILQFIQALLAEIPEKETVINNKSLEDIYLLLMNPNNMYKDFTKILDSKHKDKKLALEPKHTLSKEEVNNKENKLAVEPKHLLSGEAINDQEKLFEPNEPLDQLHKTLNKNTFDDFTIIQVRIVKDQNKNNDADEMRQPLEPVYENNPFAPENAAPTDSQPPIENADEVNNDNSEGPNMLVDNISVPPEYSYKIVNEETGPSDLPIEDNSYHSHSYDYNLKIPITDYDVPLQHSYEIVYDVFKPPHTPIDDIVVNTKSSLDIVDYESIAPTESQPTIQTSYEIENDNLERPNMATIEDNVSLQKEQLNIIEQHVLVLKKFDDYLKELLSEDKYNEIATNKDIVIGQFLITLMHNISQDENFKSNPDLNNLFLLLQNPEYLYDRMQFLLNHNLNQYDLNEKESSHNIIEIVPETIQNEAVNSEAQEKTFEEKCRCDTQKQPVQVIVQPNIVILQKSDLDTLLQAESLKPVTQIDEKVTKYYGHKIGEYGTKNTFTHVVILDNCNKNINKSIPLLIQISSADNDVLKEHNMLDINETIPVDVLFTADEKGSHHDSDEKATESVNTIDLSNSNKDALDYLFDNYDYQYDDGIKNITLNETNNKDIKLFNEIQNVNVSQNSNITSEPLTPDDSQTLQNDEKEKPFALLPISRISADNQKDSNIGKLRNDEPEPRKPIYIKNFGYKITTVRSDLELENPKKSQSKVIMLKQDDLRTPGLKLPREISKFKINNISSTIEDENDLSNIGENMLIVKRHQTAQTTKNEMGNSLNNSLNIHQSIWNETVINLTDSKSILRSQNSGQLIRLKRNVVREKHVIDPVIQIVTLTDENSHDGDVQYQNDLSPTGSKIVRVTDITDGFKTIAKSPNKNDINTIGGQIITIKDNNENNVHLNDLSSVGKKTIELANHPNDFSSAGDPINSNNDEKNPVRNVVHKTTTITVTSNNKDKPQNEFKEQNKGQKVLDIDSDSEEESPELDKIDFRRGAKSGEIVPDLNKTSEVSSDDSDPTKQKPIVIPSEPSPPSPSSTQATPTPTQTTPKPTHVTPNTNTGAKNQGHVGPNPVVPHNVSPVISNTPAVNYNTNGHYIYYPVFVPSQPTYQSVIPYNYAYSRTYQNPQPHTPRSCSRCRPNYSYYAYPYG